MWTVRVRRSPWDQVEVTWVLMSSVTRRCPGLVPTVPMSVHEHCCWNARPLKPSSGSSGHLYSLVITLLEISLLQQLMGEGWGSIRKLLKQLHTISPPFLATASHPLPTSSSQCLRESPICSLIQCWQERNIYWMLTLPGTGNPGHIILSLQIRQLRLRRSDEP